MAITRVFVVTYKLQNFHFFCKFGKAKVWTKFLLPLCSRFVVSFLMLLFVHISFHFISYHFISFHFISCWLNNFIYLKYLLWQFHLFHFGVFVLQFSVWLSRSKSFSDNYCHVFDPFSINGTMLTLFSSQWLAHLIDTMTPPVPSCISMLKISF
jgi:hypothetical protein